MDIDKDITNSQSKDNLSSIQLKLEDIISIFHESTDFILSHSEISKGNDEPDLTESHLNKERKHFERLDEEKILSFDRKVKEYADQVNGLFDDIQNRISMIDDKEEYLKSEDELKREIKELKAKQIYKSNKLSEIIELAQETLKGLEQGQQKYEMFHDS